MYQLLHGPLKSSSKALFFVLGLIAIIPAACGLPGCAYDHASVIKKPDSMASGSQMLLYPEWFLSPPPESSCSTGLTRTYLDRDEALDQAFLDGCANLCRQQKTVVSGGKIGVREGEWLDILLTDIHDLPDPGSIEEIAASAEIVCEFFSSNRCMLLVSLKPVDVECGKVVDLSEAPTPSWVSDLPEEHGFIYALGVSADTYFEREGWLAADYNMRKELASMDGRINVLLKEGDGISTSVVELVFEEPVVLNGIAAVGRWKDPETGTRYVLGRIRRQE